LRNKGARYSLLSVARFLCADACLISKTHSNKQLAFDKKFKNKSVHRNFNSQKARQNPDQVSRNAKFSAPFDRI